MSVNNTFFAIEWDQVAGLPATTVSGEEQALFLEQATHGDAPSATSVAFGPQIDPYYFESWRGLLEFNDWFRERRPSMNRDVVDPLASVFLDAGLLHLDETCAPAPIWEDVSVEKGWIYGAIPPPRVKELLTKAKALTLPQSLSKIRDEFQRAIEEEACEMVPDGETMVNWVLSLTDGLNETAKVGRGILVAAA